MKAPLKFKKGDRVHHFNRREYFTIIEIDSRNTSYPYIAKKDDSGTTIHTSDDYITLASVYDSPLYQELK